MSKDTHGKKKKVPPSRGQKENCPKNLKLQKAGFENFGGSGGGGVWIRTGRRPWFFPSHERIQDLPLLHG